VRAADSFAEVELIRTRKILLQVNDDANSPFPDDLDDDDASTGESRSSQIRKLRAFFFFFPFFFVFVLLRARELVRAAKVCPPSHLPLLARLRGRWKEEKMAVEPEEEKDPFAPSGGKWGISISGFCKRRLRKLSYRLNF